MKTDSTAAMTVRLKDGKSTIHSFERSFSQPPTVGDPLPLGEDRRDLPSFYDEMACVSGISYDEEGGLLIEAELASIPPDSARPVVVLNANRVSEGKRTEVERHLTGQLDAPVLDWEESEEPVAILRFHPMESRRGISRESLEAGLLGLLAAS